MTAELEPRPQPRARPCPHARLVGPDEPVSEGVSVWAYEGSLQRFTGYGARFQYRQRVAWPARPPWDEVREFALWMVERLSINGHLLVGLRVRAEEGPDEEWRLVSPDR